VDAAVADQAEKMEGALFTSLHGLLEERDVAHLFVGDEEIDARHVHVDDAAGTNVEVTDFAVAHLAFGEADGGAGGVDHCVGEIFEEGVVGGFAGESDGVALGFGAVAPAVEHGEDDGFGSFGHGKAGYKGEVGWGKTRRKKVDSRKLKIERKNEEVVNRGER
jgi:hypothetical protein